MSHRQLFLILVFLLTPAISSADKLPTGEELLRAWGCRSCHRIGEFGGSTAPDLSRVGKRLNASDIRLKLHPLPGQNRHALMPTFPEMSNEEVRILTDYLAGLK